MDFWCQKGKKLNITTIFIILPLWLQIQIVRIGLENGSGKNIDFKTLSYNMKINVIYFLQKIAISYTFSHRIKSISTTHKNCNRGHFYTTWFNCLLLLTLQKTPTVTSTWYRYLYLWQSFVVILSLSYITTFASGSWVRSIKHYPINR